MTSFTVELSYEEYLSKDHILLAIMPLLNEWDLKFNKDIICLFLDFKNPEDALYYRLIL